MGKFNPDSPGHKWGNPKSRGIAVDPTMPKNMTTKELHTWLKSKGVIVKTSTKDEK